MSGFDVKTLNRMLMNWTFRCAMNHWERWLLNEFILDLSNTKETPVSLYQEFKIPHNGLLYAFSKFLLCIVCLSKYLLCSATQHKVDNRC